MRKAVTGAAAAILAAAAMGQAVVDGGNGKVYAVTAQVYNYADARAAATRLGGHLATFADAGELSFVYGAFLTQFRSGLQCWIGLTDEAVEGTFVWEDGSPLGFTAWAPGEPNDCCGGEDQAVLFDFFGRPKWNDAQGPFARPALIEFEVAVSPLDGRAYVATTTGGDRAAAKAAAADAGGVLATVGSAAAEAWIEAAFAADLATDALWLGLGDELIEGAFAWESGDAFAYANWAAGQPDDAGDADGVVKGSAGDGLTWRDEPTGATFRALIEIVGVPPPAVAPGDDCATAIPAVLGPNPYDATNFFLAGPAAPCSFSAPDETYDCWFQYVAPSDGWFVASTCPASTSAVGASATPTDTYLALWTGADCGSLSLVVCEDVGMGCDVLQAEARTHVLAGQNLWIQVGAWGGGQPSLGAVSLALHPDAPNDACANAIPLSYGVNPSAPAGAPGDAFRNFGATSSPDGGPCGGGGDDVWFSFAAPYETRLSVSTATPPGFPSGGLPFLVVTVFDACGGAVVGCGPTEAQFLTTAGATYYVRVGGWSNLSGSYYLTVRDEFHLKLSSPFGPGSLAVENRAGPPGGFYFTFATPNQGAFPQGWLFGVDLTLFEYFAQSTAFSAPFFGAFDPNGASSFAVAAGLPPIALYAVSLAFDAGGAFAAPAVPVAWTIP